MQVYEGDLLPSIFHGQPIHCDAGPNVVRAYVTQPDGAGYKAEIVNILEGTQDKWFRPSDVAVAPDGSLIVADWYDPGVGGHGMGDVTRGRLFRVTTKAAEKYLSPSFKLDTVEGAVAAWKSPNEEQRYLAWVALKGFGSKAEAELSKLFGDAKAEPEHRARALWLLAALSADESAGGPAHSKTLPRDAQAPENAKRPGVLQPSGAFERLLTSALTDTDPNLRITALRAARQLWQQKQPGKLREVIAKVVEDKDAAVRREEAISLRFDESSEATQLWQKLMFDAIQQHQSNKWMVEAIGIGSDMHPELRFRVPGPDFEKLAKPAFIDDYLRFVTRTRSQATVSLAEGILCELSPEAKTLPPDQKLALLRTLQLLASKFPDDVAGAAYHVFMKSSAEIALASTALFNRNTIASNPEAKARLDELLKPVVGKAEFVSLVERLNLTGFEKELLDFIVANPNAPEAVNAARLIAMNRDGALRFLNTADPAAAMTLVAALGRVSDRASVGVLGQAFWQEKDMSVRHAIIDALALSGEGGRNILRWHSEGKLPADFKDQAALALSRSTDAGLRSEAATVLPLPAAQGLDNFPKLPELLKLKGDAAKGPQMFMQAGCVACHRVKGQYIDFGPDLSQIGAKLSAEGLFTAILYPSAAIEHSFVGRQITTKEGQSITGYVVSETDSELTLRIAGGAATTVKKTSIAKNEELKQSLMPPGLAGAIGPQGLADLVAWLQTLK